MSDDELNKLSHEDLILFEKRLTAFFNMSVDESFTQLRKHLERLFPQWRFSDASDIIDKSITRLMQKVAQFEKRGEPIANLKAFASKVAKIVSLEHHREKRIDIDDKTPPGSDSPPPPSEPKYLPDVEISAIEKQIALDCMTHCLQKISRERLELFF